MLLVGDGGGGRGVACGRVEAATGGSGVEEVLHRPGDHLA